MDLTKYPIEKLSFLLAGVIPGGAALLIFNSAVPGSFVWFVSIGFLGYRTQIAVLVFTAFIAGNTLSTFVSSIVGAIGGAIGAVQQSRPYKPAYTYMAAPWRDVRWRALAKSRLGNQAPEDLPFMSLEVLSQRLKIIADVPGENPAAALLQVQLDKSKSDLIDEYWRDWYEHFHQIVLLYRERTFEWHVQNGFNFNLETASLYVLLSASVVPSIRHWWLIAPSCVWTLLLLSETFYNYRRFTDRWQTLTEQIRYLSVDAQ